MPRSSKEAAVKRGDILSKLESMRHDCKNLTESCYVNSSSILCNFIWLFLSELKAQSILGGGECLCGASLEMLGSQTGAKHLTQRATLGGRMYGRIYLPEEFARRRCHRSGEPAHCWHPTHNEEEFSGKFGHGIADFTSGCQHCSDHSLEQSHGSQIWVSNSEFVTKTLKCDLFKFVNLFSNLVVTSNKCWMELS